MTASVLIAHSFFLHLDPKQAAKMRPYPPLATLYVAAAVREAGHHVEVFDAMLSAGEHEFEAHVQRMRPDIVVLFEDNFNFLSKMCLSRMREAALTMATAAQHAGAWVAAAGSDVSDQPEMYLRSGVDVAIFGEGDHTALEVVEWFARRGRRPAETADVAHPAVADATDGADGHAADSNHDFDDLTIEGVAAIQRDGTMRRTARRANERHPDVFAHPARDLIDIDAYRRAWRDHHGHFVLNMVSTRGCPFHCNWCAKPIWGQRYAMRTPADVAAELAQVRRDYAPDRIWFADDIFGLRPSWLVEFADLVEQAGAVVPFVMQSRADLMTPEAVSGLARAGCAEVWMGVESGSQRILDAMDKGITVQQVRDARQRLADAGIRACFFTQFGYPGERWSDIQATIALLRETLPDDVGVSVSYPLPGTRFHEMVVDQIDDDTNWSDSGDLQMLFSGTYSTAFYRQLHLAIHDDLSLRRRQAGLVDAPHPLLPTVDLDAQTQRVNAAWALVEEMERTCRNPRPTLLVRAGDAPVSPDLSKLHNYDDGTGVDGTGVDGTGVDGTGVDGTGVGGAAVGNGAPGGAHGAEGRHQQDGG